MSDELAIRLKEHDDALESFRVLCKADKCDTGKDVLTIEQTIQVSGILMAVLMLFTSVTTTYSFPVINNNIIKRHETID